MKSRPPAIIVSVLFLLAALPLFICGCGGGPSRGGSFARETVPSGGYSYSRYQTDIVALSGGWEEDETFTAQGIPSLKGSLILMITDTRDAGRAASAVESTLSETITEIALITGYAQSQFQIISSPVSGRNYVYVALAGNADTAAEIEKFGKLEAVDAVYPNALILRPEAESENLGDPSEADDWASEMINLPGYDEMESVYERRVTLGLLDTGVDAGHPGLSGAVAGVGSKDAPEDISWRGTFVSGIIAGLSTNGGEENPMRGVAEGRVKLVPETVCNGKNQCPYADVISGLATIVEERADVVQLNLCAAAATPGFSEIIDAVAAGRLAVAPACNCNKDAGGFLPAASGNVITVAGINRDGGRAVWGAVSGSNFGSAVDVAAPGVDIISTLTGDAGSYGLSDGTSFAAAYVAGLGALLMSTSKDMSPAEAKNIILETAVPIETDMPIGKGRIDAGAAFDTAYRGVNGTAYFSVSCDDTVLLEGDTTRCTAKIGDMENPLSSSADVRCVTSNGGGALSPDGIFTALASGMETLHCTYKSMETSFQINIVLPDCMKDADCDDGDPLTIDSCANAGTMDAECINSQCDVECTTDQGCADMDDLTTDTCDYPGTCDSVCSHEMCEVACEMNADCNDGDPLTFDYCLDAGTCAAACESSSCVECSSDADCDDGDALSTDTCNDPGTCSSSCSYEFCTPACTDATDCADGLFYTEDVCQGSGTCDAACTNNRCSSLSAFECFNDAGCNDGNALTTEYCDFSVQCASTCNYTTCDPVCVTDSDCDDFDSLTIDVCRYDNTCGAYCESFHEEWYSMGDGGAFPAGYPPGTGDSRLPSIAAKPGVNPVLVWEDMGYRSYGVNSHEIGALQWDGEKWVEIGEGSATRRGLSITDGDSALPSVAIDGQDRAVVVWHDSTSGNYQIYVKRWNGAFWEEMGASASGGGISNSPYIARVARIAIDPAGNPVVSWREETDTNMTYIYIKRWNGSSWEEFCPGSASGTGVPSNALYYNWTPFMTFDGSGDLIIAWTARVQYSYHSVYVQKWNGTSWEEMGAGSASGYGLSGYGDMAEMLDLKTDLSGNPILVWGSRIPQSAVWYNVMVTRWDGSSWVEMGTGSSTGGGVSNSSNNSAYAKIALDESGNIYLTYSEYERPGAFGDYISQIYLWKWDGGEWVEFSPGSTSTGGITNNSGYTSNPSITIDDNGLPIIAYDYAPPSPYTIQAITWAP